MTNYLNSECVGDRSHICSIIFFILQAHVLGAHFFDPGSSVAFSGWALADMRAGIRLSVPSQVVLIRELFLIAIVRYGRRVYQLFTELRVVLNINGFTPGPFKKKRG